MCTISLAIYHKITQTGQACHTWHDDSVGRDLIEEVLEPWWLTKRPDERWNLNPIPLGQTNGARFIKRVTIRTSDTHSKAAFRQSTCRVLRPPRFFSWKCTTQTILEIANCKSPANWQSREHLYTSERKLEILETHQETQISRTSIRWPS